MGSLHLIVVACVALAAAALPKNNVRAANDPEFAAWMEKHGRQYDTQAEYDARYTQFQITRDVVNKHNAEAAQGLHTHTLATNKFADWTIAEKKARLLGTNPPPKKRTATGGRRRINAKRSNPTTYKNWTTSGIIPPVGYQGCGNCYAFSTTYVLSYYYALAQHLTSPFLLSAEQITCGVYAPSEGCFGGYPADVITYAYNNAVDPASGYNFSSNYYEYYMYHDYTGKFNKTLKINCSATNAAAAIKLWTAPVSGYNGNSGDNNEVAMATYLGTTGPGVQLIDAVCDQFMNYNSGIISTPSLSTNCTVNGKHTKVSIDHAVMTVGYLLDPTTNLPYYLIQNSWGTDCGEAGFFKVAAFGNLLAIGENGLFYPVGLGGSAPPSTQPTTTGPTTKPPATTTTASNWCTQQDGTVEYGYLLSNCVYQTGGECDCDATEVG